MGHRRCLHCLEQVQFFVTGFSDHPARDLDCRYFCWRVSFVFVSWLPLSQKLVSFHLLSTLQYPRLSPLMRALASSTLSVTWLPAKKWRCRMLRALLSTQLLLGPLWMTFKVLWQNGSSGDCLGGNRNCGGHDDEVWCITHYCRCTSVTSDSSGSLLQHVLAFISAHVDDGHLREPLSSSAASALAVLKVTMALFFFYALLWRLWLQHLVQ